MTSMEAGGGQLGVIEQPQNSILKKVVHKFHEIRVRFNAHVAGEITSHGVEDRHWKNLSPEDERDARVSVMTDVISTAPKSVQAEIIQAKVNSSDKHHQEFVKTGNEGARQARDDDARLVNAVRQQLQEQK